MGRDVTIQETWRQRGSAVMQFDQIIVFSPQGLFKKPFVFFLFSALNVVNYKCCLSGGCCWSPSLRSSTFVSMTPWQRFLSRWPSDSPSAWPCEEFYRSVSSGGRRWMCAVF